VTFEVNFRRFRTDVDASGSNKGRHDGDDCVDGGKVSVF
jgi:hypothetical protein